MNESLTFRKAVTADVDRIWQIILQAKEQMRLLNSRQWQDGYPFPENIVQDIESGYGYVLCQEDSVIAYGAVLFDGEPAYDDIEGEWLTGGHYVVVHRLAVADEMKQRGIASLFMQRVEELSIQEGVYGFRVDTNFDNYYMHKMLGRLGFTHCGEIQYERGSRLAFEKRLSQ